MKRFAMLVLSLLLLLGISPAAAQSSLQVIATFSILGDIVQNVAGDAVTLTVLVPADSDAHSFEPSPSDAAALASADIIFEIGVEFETWLDALYAAAGTQAGRIVVTTGIELLPFEEHHDDDHADATPDPMATPDDHADDHGEFDPHVWQDPLSVIVIVENVRDALIAADPANTALYKANALRYIDELRTLHDDITAQVDTLPADARKLVTTHDTFGYFAARYGFEIVGTILGITSVNDPSAADVAALVDAIRSTGIRTIFVENVTNVELVALIAQEAGVTIAPALYTDALGAPGTPGETYLDMMRYNVATIVTALSQ